MVPYRYRIYFPLANSKKTVEFGINFFDNLS